MTIEPLDWRIIWPVWAVRDSHGRAVFYCEDLSAAKAYLAGHADGILVTAELARKGIT